MDVTRKKNRILAEMKKGIQSDFINVEKDMRSSVSQIKDELEDHLHAINQNTDEVSKFYNCIDELDTKLDKVNSRLDTMHMMFRQVMNQATVSVDLSLDEQRLFIMLDACSKFLTISDLAERAGMKKEEADEALMSMTDKGIPMERKVHEKEPCIKLDPEFKILNRRQSMIKISPSVTQQFENKVLNSFFG